MLESDHFFHDPVAHLDRADENQKVEDQLEQERPDNRCSIGACVDCRVLRQHRVDDTCKDNDYTLQAHPGIRFQKGSPNLGGTFTGERCKRDRSDRGVHEDLKDARIDGQNHNE